MVILHSCVSLPEGTQTQRKLQSKKVSVRANLMNLTDGLTMEVAEQDHGMWAGTVPMKQWREIAGIFFYVSTYFNIPSGILSEFALENSPCLVDLPLQNGDVPKRFM